VNRVGDYCSFVIRFVGLGYVVLWPFAQPSPLSSGLCRDDALSWPSLCNCLDRFPHVFSLPPGLHVIGMVCAGCLSISVMVRPLSRWRRDGAQRAVMLAARIPAAVTRSPQRKPLGPHRNVKPRNHFGLRGSVPH